VRGTFDYLIPAEGPPVEVGSLLWIRFGRQRCLGVVRGLAEESELPLNRLAEPERVVENSIPPDLVELAGWMAREFCSTEARALSLILPPGASEGVGIRRALVAELTPAGRRALGEESIRLTGGQRELLDSLATRGPMPATELGTARLRRLEARGLVSLEPRESPRRPLDRPLGTASVLPPPLTLDQRRALEAVEQALAAPPEPDQEGLLLHGVTGSGKTEVYLQAVAWTLKDGRSAIVLVPEIALTPQLLWRFQRRFGDVVAVLHSGLGVGERHDEWLRLRRGEARVCVGPRSAVFAPVSQLGLVVVDEEHESSYKHEGDPRYDARLIARERARRSGGLLLCGSATPRPESMARLRRLRLPTRVDGRPMPSVEMVDMRGHHQPLHPDTRMALADLRRARGKAIILVNRRGWSNFLSCRSCGQVWLCPNCDVALVLHRHSGLVACHHCGHRERAPDRCRACGSVSVARHGAGTERVEHELSEALGGEAFGIYRLDADSSRLPDRTSVLERFSQARSGVLIGTQMVAKGHDFPDVTLGVVLDADQTLRFPDFRAEERTFALITQLAGRTGRGDHPGRVLVQTLAPDARALRYAAGHDADGFLADELQRRRVLAYPPYASLIRVLCSAESEPLAVDTAQQMALRLGRLAGTVLGPAPLFRLRGRARRQLVVKATDRGAAIAAVGRAVEEVGPAAARRGASVSVDVDPQ
jgi:primosomal protein N' (replication factor Y)